MLLGIWKSIEELESSITLEELKQLIDVSREKKYQQNKFLAAIKGINLDGTEDAKNRFEEVSRRAEAKLAGKSEEELEFAAFGIDFDTT